MNFDLHIHTSFSDGGGTVQEIINEAKEDAIGLISITDHNGYEAYKNASKYNWYGIKYINGMEIDVLYNQYLLHILLYNFDLNSKLIMEYDKKNREYEIERFLRLIKLFEIQNIIKLDSKIINKFIKENQYFDKVRLNNLIVLHGLCETPKEAFYKYTRDLKEEPRMVITFKEILKLEKDSNGVLSLAHPMKYSDDYKEVEQLILNLNKDGLRSVEVFNNRQSISLENQLLELCKKNNIYMSGGSDYHAKYGSSETKKLGSVLGHKLCDKEINIFELF